jgi:hypothetical protein
MEIPIIMLCRTFCRWAIVIVLVVSTIGTIPEAAAQSGSSPTLSTLEPLSGMVGDTFYVYLPVMNTGKGTVISLKVTSALLGSAQLEQPKLPIPLGSLAPGGRTIVNLRFNDGNLFIGHDYLLRLSGSYVSGAMTVPFAASRSLIVTQATNFLQTEVEHWQAIDAISAKFDSLPGLNRDADNMTMLTFLRSRPEFVDSDIEPEYSSVWGKFSDGQEIIIANNTRLGSATSASNVEITPSPARMAFQDSRLHEDSGNRALSESLPTDSTASPGLPESATAHALSTVGLGFPSPDIDVGSWLSLQHYNLANGRDASVYALENSVTNDGVFYIYSHGGAGRLTRHGAPIYGVWTSTKADLDTEVDDMLSGRIHLYDLDEIAGIPPALVEMIAAAAINPLTKKAINETHYAVTQTYVKNHWHFSKNSFVYIDACKSDFPGAAQLFKQAVFKAGGAVYAGWQPIPGAIGDGNTDFLIAAETARLVFDRLLGADQYCPEDGTPCHRGHADAPPFFAQRPFDYSSTSSDLPLHSLGADVVAGAILDFTPGTDSTNTPTIDLDRSLLAPSIGFMTMDETKSELTINGIFGETTGSVEVGGEINSSSGIQVLSGGKDVTVKEWGNDKVVVELPLSGTGSGGNVQVAAGQHISNVAQLTEWKVPFTFTLMSNPSLLQTQDFKVHLRADIRKWRPVIHKEPIEPGTDWYAEGLESANDSTATVMSTGSATDSSTGQTYKWSGSDTFVNFYSNLTPKDNFFALSGVVKNSHDGTFALDDAASRGFTCNICDSSGCTEHPGDEFVTGPFFWLNPLGTPIFQPFGFDDKGSILAPPQPVIGTDPYGVPCTPFPGTGRASLNWSTVAPTQGTAPNPKSAR